MGGAEWRRRKRESVCLYIIYRDIESVHACLAPSAHVLSPLATAHTQGWGSTCKLGFSPKRNPGDVSGREEDVLIAVNQGRGLQPSHPSPI